MEWARAVGMVLWAAALPGRRQRPGGGTAELTSSISGMRGEWGLYQPSSNCLLLWLCSPPHVPLGYVQCPESKNRWCNWCFLDGSCQSCNPGAILSQGDCRPCSDPLCACVHA